MQLSYIYRPPGMVLWSSLEYSQNSRQCLSFALRFCVVEYSENCRWGFCWVMTGIPRRNHRNNSLALLLGWSRSEIHQNRNRLVSLTQGKRKLHRETSPLFFRFAILPHFLHSLWNIVVRALSMLIFADKLRSCIQKCLTKIYNKNTKKDKRKN